MTPSRERITKGYQVPAAALVGFDEFWQVYPKKSNKGDAKLAWYQVRATERGLLAAILEALAWQRKTFDWIKGDPPGQFIPYPASYLRAEKWEDAPTIVNAGASQKIDDERERAAALLKQRAQA